MNLKNVKELTKEEQKKLHGGNIGWYCMDDAECIQTGYCRKEIGHMLGRCDTRPEGV